MTEVKSVFLIEDDKDDQAFFMDALRNIENTLLSDVAADGRDAIEKLRGMAALPSIIFVDYNMPIMNGLEFLKEKSKYPLIKHIPAVMLTSSYEKREEALRDGAKLFIVKPRSGDILREEVEQAIKTGL